MEYVLLFGANIGDKKSVFDHAIDKLEDNNIVITQKSAIYHSAAWGFESSDSFINMVVVVQTSLLPEQLIALIFKIEKALGRKRNQNVDGYLDRTIDIDILFYEHFVYISKNLIIPHQNLHKRRFTLMPLCEIMPNFVHPIFQQSMEDLLKYCKDKSIVNKDE